MLIDDRDLIARPWQSAAEPMEIASRSLLEQAPAFIDSILQDDFAPLLLVIVCLCVLSASVWTLAAGYTSRQLRRQLRVPGPNDDTLKAELRAAGHNR